MCSSGFSAWKNHRPSTIIKRRNNNRKNVTLAFVIRLNSMKWKILFNEIVMHVCEQRRPTTNRTTRKPPNKISKGRPCLVLWKKKKLGFHGHAEPKDRGNHRQVVNGYVGLPPPSLKLFQTFYFVGCRWPKSCPLFLDPSEILFLGLTLVTWRVGRSEAYKRLDLCLCLFFSSFIGHQ